MDETVVVPVNGMPRLNGARLKAAFMESVSHRLHKLHAMPDPPPHIWEDPCCEGQYVKDMN